MKDKFLFRELVKANEFLAQSYKMYQDAKELMFDTDRFKSVFYEKHIKESKETFKKVGNEFAHYLNELSQSNDFGFSFEKGVFCANSSIEMYTFSKGLVSSYLIDFYLGKEEDKMLKLNALFIKVKFVQNKIDAIERATAFLELDSELKGKLDGFYLQKETEILPKIVELVGIISKETKLALEYNKLTNSLMVNGANVESEFVIHHLA